MIYFSCEASSTCKRGLGCLPVAFRPAEKVSPIIEEARFSGLYHSLAQFHHNDGTCWPERAQCGRSFCTTKADRSASVHSLSSFFLECTQTTVGTKWIAQISTFRPQRLRIPSHGGRFSAASTGSASWRATAVAAGPAAVRFNSSSTHTTAAQTPGTTDPGALTEAGDLADFDITTLPEKIGYLKELGLDYGWGPTSIMQYVIEHIHIWSDMPWWASIVGAGLLVRLILLKPMLDASDISAKMHNVKPITNPLRQEMMRAVKENNQVEIHRKRAAITQAHVDAGVQMWKTMVPMLQIPFGYGIFRLVRGMTSLPVPAIMSESLFWLNDMTISDPMFILPGLTSLFMYLTFKVCELP